MPPVCIIYYTYVYIYTPWDNKSYGCYEYIGIFLCHAAYTRYILFSLINLFLFTNENLMF